MEALGLLFITSPQGSKTKKTLSSYECYILGGEMLKLNSSLSS